MSLLISVVETRDFFFGNFHFTNSAKIIKLVASKRTRDALTGGTGDVSPQLLGAIVTLSAANTFTQTTVPVPIQRYSAGRERALVMEVLKVFFDLGEPDANPAAGGSLLAFSAYLSTSSQASFPTMDNPVVFAFGQKVVRGAFTAAGTYGTYASDPFTLDLTDGAGHGVLVATDNIFLGAVSSGFTAVSACSIKILYRFKEVTLAEYIGIVQSQQQ